MQRGMAENDWGRQTTVVTDPEKTPWHGRKKPWMWSLVCVHSTPIIICTVRTPCTAFGKEFFSYSLFHTLLLELRGTYNHNVTCLPLRHTAAEGAAERHA